MQFTDIEIGQEYYADDRNLRTDYGDERGRVRVVAKGRYRKTGRYGTDMPKDAIGGYVEDNKAGKPMVVVERVDGKPTSHVGHGMQAVIATRSIKSTWAERVETVERAKVNENKAERKRIEFNTALRDRAEAIREVLTTHGLGHLAARPVAGWGTTEDLGRTQHKLRYSYTSEQMAELICELTGIDFNERVFPALPTEGLVE